MVFQLRNDKESLKELVDIDRNKNKKNKKYLIKLDEEYAKKLKEKNDLEIEYIHRA